MLKIVMVIVYVFHYYEGILDIATTPSTLHQNYNFHFETINLLVKIIIAILIKKIIIIV